MLYLEDYLEMIEHLPQELRDRFTEMREMDLSVQNIMDTLDKRSKVFFTQCRRNEIQGSSADNEFEDLRKDYYKVLEDADEKVALATQMHELVERYLRRLDSELFKFKCELEADNNGITEVLEKRSLELDGNSSISSILNQKENRYFGAIGGNNLSQKDKIFRHRPEKRRDSSSMSIITPIVEKRQNLGSNIITTATTPIIVQPVRPITPSVTVTNTVLSSNTITPSATYSVSLINQASNQNIGSNINTVSTNQSIITTQQQLQQNRRAAIHGTTAGPTTHELLLGRDLNNVTHNVISGIERDSALLQNQRRHKKKIITGLPHGPGPSSAIPTSSLQPPAAHVPTVNSPIVDPILARVNENGLVVEQTAEGEWTYDPNEPRYCICNQVSYGDMVACDNEACPFEWFHYPCVGITQSPKGKWYCPKCTASMRRRSRKN